MMTINPTTGLPTNAFYAQRSEADGFILAITQYGKCVRLNRSTVEILELIGSGLSRFEVVARLSTHHGLSPQAAEEALGLAVDKLALAGFFEE